MVNRAKLRGKPLDEDCKTARTTTHEYGKVDDRVFCRGLSDKRTDTPIEKCYGCKAFVENASPIWTESAKSLSDMIAEAKEKALKEDIKANTVIIDNHFAKVNAFDFVFGRAVMSLPPMICGLEVQVSDEFPDGYDFAVLETPKTERELLIRKAKSEAAREICCKIEEEIVAALESNYRARKEHIERYAELAYDTELLLEINGKINALRGIEGFVEELKKKYAEGEK